MMLIWLSGENPDLGQGVQDRVPDWVLKAAWLLGMLPVNWGREEVIRTQVRAGLSLELGNRTRAVTLETNEAVSQLNATVAEVNRKMRLIMNHLRIGIGLLMILFLRKIAWVVFTFV